MILVDVFVPAIDKTYNFSLDEAAPIAQIVEELIELVERAEQTTFAGDRAHVQLVNKATRTALSAQNTLKECAVSTGSTLILV